MQRFLISENDAKRVIEGGGVGVKIPNSQFPMKRK